MSAPATPVPLMAKTSAVFNIALLALVGATAHMFGEFLREGAVLLLVFIPLDLWKHSETTGLRLTEVGFLSLALLGGGMFLEFGSLLCKRVQRALEGGEN